MKTKHRIVAILIIASFGLSQLSTPALSLWPSIVALISVVLFRSTLGGLMIGAVSGVILISNGNPGEAFTSFFSKILLPALSSEWNVSVLIFTLLLGGFASLLEKGGGFDSILQIWLRKSGNLKNKVQWSAFSIGILYALLVAYLRERPELSAASGMLFQASSEWFAPWFALTFIGVLIFQLKLKARSPVEK